MRSATRSPSSASSTSRCRRPPSASGARSARRSGAKTGSEYMSAIQRIDAVHPEVARALRAMSGMERLRLAHETWEMVRDQLTAYFAAGHPEWSRVEIQRHVARRLLDESGRAAPLPR